MAQLDPFVIQWPQKWVEDPEIAPVINYLNLFLHDLHFVLDGGSAIENLESTIITNTSISNKLTYLSTSLSEISQINVQNNNSPKIAVLEKRINDLEMQQ